MPARNLRVVPDTPGRAVCYIRVSALMGRGGEDFHSPEVQLGAIRNTISTAGLREVATIDDIDRTGRHFNREGIDKIRVMAEARQVDVVAVYDLSRLGRNAKEALVFIDWLTAHGVGVISASEKIDTSTPAGKLMLQQFLSFAEFYSNTMGRNWSAIIARRAEQGLAHGRAMGYIRKDLGLHVHPIDGPAMATAFARFAAGDPISDVARQLAASTGRRVWSNTLKKQMQNPVYLGNVNIRGRVLPGKHEPLVDQPTWDLVQARIARERFMPSRHLGPTWSLVGITYCPNGHHLQRNPARDVPGGPKLDRLVCGWGRGGSTETCTVGRPLAPEVEAEVLRRVAEYVRLLRDDVGAQAAKRARAATVLADRSNMEQQLTTTRTAMARIAKEWALGRLGDDVYNTTMSDLQESEAVLVAAVASAVQAGQTRSPAEVANAAERLLGLWDDMTIAERNRVLRLVVDRVVVRGPARWREPVADRTEVFFF